MPPRNPELPEGTDHVVNGAMDTGTGGGGGGSTPIGGTAGSGTAAGGTGGLAGGSGSLGGSTGAGLGSGTGSTGGFIGSGTSDGTGGTTGLGGSGGSSGSGSGQPVKQQLRDGAQTVKSQATDKVRSYAAEGKDRAAGALDEFAQAITESAQSIDERLGAQYGNYARQAAGTITDFSNRLRDKEVDELYNDARDLVRKSPAVAIGTAAAVGFALVRLIKVGLDEGRQGGTGGGQSLQGGGSQSFGGSSGGSPSFGGQSSLESNTPQAPSVGGPTAGV